MENYAKATNIQNKMEGKMENTKTKRSSAHRLWWEDKEAGVRSYAGVAFYDELFGEYRLKPDSLFGDERQILCRAESFINESIRYRVEVVQKRSGKFWRRQKIGEGYSNVEETGGDIYLEIPPYNHGYRLVLILNDELDGGEENEVA